MLYIYTIYILYIYIDTIYILYIYYTYTIYILYIYIYTSNAATGAVDREFVYREVGSRFRVLPQLPRTARVRVAPEHPRSTQTTPQTTPPEMRIREANPQIDHFRCN